MGMAASQGRFLALTSRKNDIGCELSRLSNQKVSLSRDMQKISSEYREAQSSKVLKWSNNSGVSYIDLTYSNLMKPSSMNQQQPYLLTDSSGKVVIDSSYQKYAEMISPDGRAGGDWESNRNKILVDLVGIDESKFANYDTCQANLDSAQAYLDNLNVEKEKNIDPLKKKFEKHNTADLLEELGSTTGGGSFSSKSNWKDAYNNSDTIKISSESELQGIANQLKKLSAYFPDIDKDEFETAIDNSIKGSLTSIASGEKIEEGGTVSGSSKDGYKVDVVSLINAALATANVEKYTSDNAYAGSTKANYIWYDTDTDEYKDWYQKDQDWQKRYDEGLATYNAAESALEEVFTASAEGEIAFYDAIFTAIAEKGWTYNNDVKDTNYLNEMLQNGSYTLTTMTKSLYTDGSNDDGTANYRYEYSTDIASNNNHVYPVNDTDTQNEAMAEYEYKKSIINAKETRIDTRMQDLQTEQSAIQQMLAGLDSVKNENIERTFSIFG